jgi:hypothetical protein
MPVKLAPEKEGRAAGAPAAATGASLSDDSAIWSDGIGVSTLAPEASVASTCGSVMEGSSRVGVGVGATALVLTLGVVRSTIGVVTEEACGSPSGRVGTSTVSGSSAPETDVSTLGSVSLGTANEDVLASGSLVGEGIFVSADGIASFDPDTSGEPEQRKLP